MRVCQASQHGAFEINREGLGALSKRSHKSLRNVDPLEPCKYRATENVEMIFPDWEASYEGGALLDVSIHLFSFKAPSSEKGHMCCYFFCYVF